MFNWYAIFNIARLEAKLLFRSWAFRIFSIIGLIFIIIFDIALGSAIGDAPHALRAISGAMPMFNIKLLNVYQGVIVVLLATEFIKRDRRFDSSQVLLTRSFSNVEYFMGKGLGILIVFGILNLVTLLPAIIIHAFFSSAAPFAPMAYVYYAFVISLPTLVLMMGLGMLFVTLMRSQALVFFLLLAFSAGSLILLGHKLYYVLDVYAYHQPFMFSDFTGLSNLNELLMVRGAFFLLGVAAMAGSAMLMNRLNQSMIHNSLAGVVMAVAAVAAVGMSGMYLSDKYANESYRDQLRALSQRVAAYPIAEMNTCDLKIKTGNDYLEGSATVELANRTDQPLDSILMTINPGLKVREISSGANPLDFRQEEHLVWIKPAPSLLVGNAVRATIEYSGRLDDRYAFLDIDDERYNKPSRLFMYTFPRKFGIVTDRCVHLTQESGWYPRAGLSPGVAYPSGAELQYTNYTLEAEVPSGLTALSQGVMSKVDETGNSVWRFVNDQPLPQISLSAAKYEERSIEVDSVEYSLYTLPGHDYYMDYFDQVSDTLPKLIEDLKNEYEMALGLEYPFNYLRMVEAPIDFQSFDRYWTLAREGTQPGLVYLSEMGMFNGGADFKRMKEGAKRRQERANQADNPVDIQTSYFQTWARTTLLGNEQNWQFDQQVVELEQSCYVLPMFVTYRTFIESSRWPVLNYAYESYFNSFISVPQNTRGRMWRGMTDVEKSNLALQRYSLAEVLENPQIEVLIKASAISMKGNYLLALISSQIDSNAVEGWMRRFLREHQYQTISDTTFLAYADSLSQRDLEPTIDNWYRGTELPGYWVQDVESYKVLDVDRVRTQVKFKLSNPSSIDGLVQVGLDYRQQGENFGPWFMRSVGQHDFTQTIALPAHEAKEIGYVVDRPVQQLSIETYVSRNLPSVVAMRFRDEKLRDDEYPWVGVKDIPSDSVFGQAGEFLVDNEDPGFNIMRQPEENWLRRTLMQWFGDEEDQEQYVGMRFWNPPGHWIATTDQDFFGTYVHSAYYKKSGSGEANVAWQVDLDETADYDIYYYCTKARIFMWGRRGRPQQEDFGKRTFLVYHENGVDETPLDLNGVEEGWNLIGTYRLQAGTNQVEMTDETSTNYITADAVKWVKREKREQR